MFLDYPSKSNDIGLKSRRGWQRVSQRYDMDEEAREIQSERVTQSIIAGSKDRGRGHKPKNVGSLYNWEKPAVTASKETHTSVHPADSSY